MTGRLGVVMTLLLAACSDEAADAGPASGGAHAGGSAGMSGSGGWSGAAGSTGGTGNGPSCVTAAPSIARVGATFDVPTLSETAPKRNPDVVHDPAHDVYLVVTGSEVISGVFVDGDGQVVGSPFAVAPTQAYTQTPRAAFGGGKALVAWHDGSTQPAPQLRARLVSWTGSAPELGASDVPVGNGDQSYQEMAPAIAFSETSALFLVVWQKVPDDDLRARRIDASGNVIGDEIVLSADPHWQSGASVAWSVARDEFLVTWAHAGENGAAVRAQRVGADGSLLGSVIELGTASGTWTTQAAYSACDDHYVVGWVDGGGSARVVQLDGTGEPTAPAFTLPAGYGYPEGFALAHHPSLHVFIAVMHGPTDEDYALAFSGDGQQSSVLQATSSPGDEGHFNPRVVANPVRDEWLLITSRGFSSIVAQRLKP